MEAGIQDTCLAAASPACGSLVHSSSAAPPTSVHSPDVGFHRSPYALFRAPQLMAQPLLMPPLLILKTVTLPTWGPSGVKGIAIGGAEFPKQT